jgi:hypothetical protein
MGVREDEICGRLVGDIEWIDTEIGPVAYLKIRDSKTASSSRDVPIHKLILELGFLEYRYYGRASCGRGLTFARIAETSKPAYAIPTA